MPSHPARATALQAAAVVLVTLLAAAGGAAAAPDAPTPLDRAAPDDAAALAAARDRVARADASVESLERGLSPGHLTDPMPDADRLFGLATLRLDYADVQRKAAGYRATLGDHHPTLAAAEQVLADLRTQLLDATRKALAAAERDDAEARAAAAALERRLAARAAPGPARAEGGDVTGSITPTPRARIPAVLPVPAASGASDAAGGGPPTAREPSDSNLPGGTLAGVGTALLALATAVWAALQLLGARRRAPPQARRRVEPPLSSGAVAAVAPPERGGPDDASQGAAADAVPVLGALPAVALAGADAAAGLHATLRAAFAGGPDDRMTVLVAPTAGATDAEAEAVALALAMAAAAAGRRALVMEARVPGRLRRARVEHGAAPLLIEAGGALRTLYRVAAGGFTVAVLPCDPGEAEAAAAAERRPGTARLQGLAGFDTVVLLGGDIAALARNADLALLAAPAKAPAATLAEAAAPARAAGRPCGAVSVLREATTAALPRVAASRLGLRGTFAPGERRLAG